MSLLILTCRESVCILSLLGLGPAGYLSGLPPGIMPGGQPLGNQGWGLEDEQAGYRSRGGPRTAAVRCPPGDPRMDTTKALADFREINIVGKETFHIR